MAVKFGRYFKLVQERAITYSQILEEANISGNILTRMRRNEYVSLESIEKICRALDCDINDILEFVADNKKDRKVDEQSAF